MNGKEFQQAVHPNNSPRSDVTSDSKWGKDFTALAPTGVVFPPVPLGAITRDMIEFAGPDTAKERGAGGGGEMAVGADKQGP